MNLNYLHNVDLTQGEVSAILYYIESFYHDSDDNPDDDQVVMSIFKKLESLTDSL